MFKDLRSPSVKAASLARLEQMGKELRTKKKERIALAQQTWGKLPWKRITECPFENYEHENIFVTDGKTVCLASPKKRFGTPMRVIEEPTMTMTDSGFGWTGGKYAKIKAPKWWFKWELTNELEDEEYAGGDPIGKPEIPFIATHWLPMLPNFEQ